MGRLEPTFTDYAPDCGDLPLSFLELMAQCVVEYNGHYYLNVHYTTDYCDDLTPLIDCDNNGLSPNEILQHIFALDECGNLAIKIFQNAGEE